MTKKSKQTNVLDHREDPGMIDAGIISSKISQKNSSFLRSTRDMGRSIGLNLKDVVRHLLGISVEDVCVSWCTNEVLDRWHK